MSKIYQNEEILKNILEPKNLKYGGMTKNLFSRLIIELTPPKRSQFWFIIFRDAFKLHIECPKFAGCNCSMLQYATFSSMLSEFFNMLQDDIYKMTACCSMLSKNVVACCFGSMLSTMTCFSTIYIIFYLYLWCYISIYYVYDKNSTLDSINYSPSKNSDTLSSCGYHVVIWCYKMLKHTA